MILTVIYFLFFSSVSFLPKQSLCSMKLISFKSNIAIPSSFVRSIYLIFVHAFAFAPNATNISISSEYGISISDKPRTFYALLYISSWCSKLLNLHKWQFSCMFFELVTETFFLKLFTSESVSLKRNSNLFSP